MLTPILLALCAEDEQKTEDSLPSCKGDLVLPIGSFLVCSTGVTAILKPPVPKHLSRHYPWKQVPQGIGLLQLLIYGDNATSDMVFSQFNDCEMALSNETFGSMRWIEEDGKPVILYDSDFVESLVLLAEWAPLLARQCPFKSVSYDLEKMNEWDIDELDNYVMRSFVN